MGGDMMPSESVGVTSVRTRRGLAAAAVRARKGAALRRARFFYFSFLGASLGLFTLAQVVGAHPRHPSTLGLFHFIVLLAAIGCALAMWYTAVMIASVHKVAWPLTLSTFLVATACLVRLATWFLPA
jgi:hypothetical protein